MAKNDLNAKQDRAQQLVHERQALLDIQTKVEDLQTELVNKKDEYSKLQALCCHQQLERYTRMEEYHNLKRTIQQEQRRSVELQQAITQLEQEILETQQFHEELVVVHRRKKMVTTDTLIRPQDAVENTGAEPVDDEAPTQSSNTSNNCCSCNLLDHVNCRQSYIEAFELRIRAQEAATRQRQSRLNWLDNELRRIQSESQPHTKSERKRLVGLEILARQDMAQLIQDTIPHLANRVREALVERGRLRKTLKEAHDECEQAQSIMEQAERHYLERTNNHGS